MCRCEEIGRIWNKEDKTAEDLKFLSIAVPEQFIFESKYFDEDEDTGYRILKCRDCGIKIEVPYW